jgi:hypothetical protein
MVFSPKAQDKMTEEAMQLPQVGDRFTEMYSFWMYVVARVGDVVVTREGSPPVTFPEGAALKSYTLAEFRERFSCGSIPGYWVSLVDRGNDVRGWDEEGDE